MVQNFKHLLLTQDLLSSKHFSEVVAGICSKKYVFVKNLQNLQANLLLESPC